MALDQRRKLRGVGVYEIVITPIDGHELTVRQRV
jgi:hypothetical protein